MNTRRGTTLCQFKVSGARACFRRPEFKEDFVSYDVISPMIARRMIAASSTIRTHDWRLKRIMVLNPIRSAWDLLVTPRGRRRALVLLDVCYLLEVELSPEAAEDPCHSLSGRATVHLGLPDFAGTLHRHEGDEPVSALAHSGVIDLGWILFDTEKGQRDRFFRARMADGIIDLGEDAELTLAM